MTTRLPISVDVLPIIIQSLTSPYGQHSYCERAEQLIREIKCMFSAMRDGEISPSAYDTTLVARVPAIDDSTCPQLPETLEWVLQNQPEDGSWGLQSHFVASDRLLNTLSCVLALSKWKIGHIQVKQVETLHSVRTSLLYSTEGLQEMIDWKRIGDVQCEDGSFLNSPASTACVFMHTGDPKCLSFLNNMLLKFGNCVPCLYPLDLFERLSAVDIVQRFRRSKKRLIMYWNQRGIGWARGSPVADLEITAMGLRILRLYQYDVSPGNNLP
eukprot:Gb_38471 [translate_table: standard]